MNVLRNLRLINSSQTHLILRSYAFKSDLKIKWVRPERIDCYKPEKSGDLDPMPKIDKCQTALDYQKCKELEDADELVKKLFSLEFQPRKKSTQSYIREVVGSVRQHELDRGSIEAKIARWTGAIRTLQDVMDVHVRNRRLKVNLKELIERRKKHLKYLRRWDYKRFEWLLESLNLVYKPYPLDGGKVTRKGSLIKLTDKFCDDIVQDRLDTYKRHLQEQQPAFLEEKIRTLEFLQNEQRECQVEVTILQDEIENVRKQLNSLLKERSLQKEE